MSDIANLVVRLSAEAEPLLNAFADGAEGAAKYTGAATAADFATGRMAMGFLSVAAGATGVGAAVGIANAAIAVLGLQSTFAARCLQVLGVALGVLGIVAVYGPLILRLSVAMRTAGITATLWSAAMKVLGSNTVQAAFWITWCVASIYLYVKAAEIAIKVTVGLVRALIRVAMAAVNAAVAIGRIKVPGGGAMLTGLAVGAMAAAAAFGVLTMKGFEYGTQLNQTAQRMGASTEELAGLKLAGATVGMTFDQVEGAVTKAQIAIAKSLTGNKQATAAFDRLGLSAASLAEKSGPKQFEEIATAIAKLPTAAERSGAAMRLFGEGGVEMVGKLSMIAAEFENGQARAEAFGLAINGTEAQGIENANMAVGQLGELLLGIGTQMAVAIAPYVTAIATGIAKWATDFQLAKKAGEAVTFVIIEGARFIGDSLDAIWLITEHVKNGFRALGIMALMVFDNILWAIEAVGKAIGVSLVTGLRDGTKQMQKDLAQAGLASFKEQEKLFSRSKTTGDQFADSLKSIAAAQVDVAKKTAETKAALGNTTVAMETKEQKAIDQTLESLREKVATYGMAAGALQVYRLQQQGAQEHEIEEAKGLQKQLAQLKAQEDLRKELTKNADAVKAANKTEEEEFKDHYKKLYELWKNNLISYQDFKKSMDKARADLRNGWEERRANMKVGAIEAGSQEALSIARQARQPKTSSADREIALGREALAEAKVQTRILGKIETAIDDSAEPTVIDL